MADDSQRDNALFVNLVLIFQSAAMQQMGKIINPLTGKVERNLEQARFSIDTLSMLKEKTRGNLSSDLERLLDSTLLQLRMNFVEESRSDDSRSEETASGSEAAAPATDKRDGGDAGAPSADAPGHAACGGPHTPGEQTGSGDLKSAAAGARPADRESTAAGPRAKRARAASADTRSKQRPGREKEK